MSKDESGFEQKISQRTGTSKRAKFCDNKTWSLPKQVIHLQLITNSANTEMPVKNPTFYVL